MSSLLDALAAEPPVIEDVALAIAEDEYPGLAKDGYRHKLDEMAEALAPELRGVDDFQTRVANFTGHVYGRLGFRGNAESYYDPRNSYLNEVIDRRKGIPISLSVVLMALGRRLGLKVEGVGFPGHFLVRVGGPGGLYLDPFSEGHVLDKDDLADLARRFLGERASFARRHLEPVDVRAMTVRMLYNLQQAYERRGDHARALVVCDRLVDVDDAPFHRRDRGLHALELGAHKAALEDLSAYLERVPDAEDAAAVRQLRDRARSEAATPSN